MTDKTWTSIYLRAENNEVMLGHLEEAGLVINENEERVIVDNENSYVADIGVVVKNSGVFAKDEEGNEYEIQEAVPGYHVNVLTCNPSVVVALKPITIDPRPVTPYAEWEF